MFRHVAAHVRRHWSVAAPLGVLLCTAGLVIASPQPTSLGAVLPKPAQGAPFRAYVFFQPVDCSGNLEFLRILARPKFRAAIAVTGMLAPGTRVDEEADAKRRFGALTGGGVVIPSSRQVAAALVPLGYRTTPFVVVLDREGQVRLATSVPQSFEASRGFERQLAELALHTPSRSE
jgi:hypothetical protein